MAISPDQTTAGLVLARCKILGFALGGICEAQPTAYEQELLDWLAAGKQGEMAYLQRNIELRIDPRQMVNGARSIICVADRYADHMADQQGADSQDEGRGGWGRFGGRIARYARGDDYHVVMRKRLALLCKELHVLFPGETFRACVDTAPVLEREHAQRAGLGAVGKNTLLIDRGVGSYLLLGEIITTLMLQPTSPCEPDPCSTCTRCIDACPTSAITPWSVDATRCISYLTIEHRSAIDEKYHRSIGDWIFGCDVCQEVCPHNQPTARSRERTHEIPSDYSSRREEFDLLEILNWDEQARRAAFIKSSMKRAKLDMMKRNALIVAGNALRHRESDPLRRRMQQMQNDADESTMVRETASAVLRKLAEVSAASAVGP